ncbi:MAG: PLP-dependent aminotransferase family protein [Chloroflexota bacterium]
MTDLPVTQISLPPGFIDLGMGNPDFDLLPLELLHRSAETYFAAGDRRTLQYGAEPGDGNFRRALADFISTACGSRVDPGLLFVTAGASSALDLVCSLYTRPGDVIFAEEPSYFLALRIFADHGLRVVPIPMDDDGLRLDLLEEELLKARPKFVYTIPAFQNPSGRTLSQPRREELVELAQRHNFLVVADEVYQFLHYGPMPPQPFAAFTADVEQVISVNSFSKILAPGLRLGWVQAHAKVIGRLAGSGLLDSGGGMAPFTSAVVRGMVESGGLAENIARLRLEYARRLAALDAALRRYLPQAEYALPQGGFFFWVRLPGVDAAGLRREAQAFEVGIRQGMLFSSRNGMQDHVRLAFCFYREEALEEGVIRLKRCLDQS